MGIACALVYHEGGTGNAPAPGMSCRDIYDHELEQRRRSLIYFLGFTGASLVVLGALVVALLR